MATKTNRFRPSLEQLGERALPSVECGMQGSLLVIQGGPEANTITITDDGTAAGVTVEDELGNVYIATGTVTSILVNSGEGDDIVTYDGPDLMAVSRIVDVELGKGSDWYEADIAGMSIPTGVSLTLTAQGNGGGDTMLLNAQNVSTASGSNLIVFFDGDGGKDTITLDTTGLTALGFVDIRKDQRH